MESISQVPTDAHRETAAITTTTATDHNRPDRSINPNGRGENILQNPPNHANHNSSSYADNHGLDALQAATAAHPNEADSSIAENHHHRSAIESSGQHNAHQQGDSMSASAVVAVAAAAVTAAEQLGQYTDGSQEHLPVQPSQGEPSNDADGPIPVELNISYQVDPALGVDVDHAPPPPQFDHSASPPSAAANHQASPEMMQQGPDHYLHSPPAAPQALPSNGLHAANHQQQYHAPVASSEVVSPNSPTPRTPGSSASKKTRLSRACDGCSLRKVKCDSSGPPCKPCAELKVPCTNEREKKRRGPPNRHLEKLRQGPMAIKRMRINAIQTQGPPDLAPADTDKALLQISPETPTTASSNSGAEELGPISLIDVLIRDFFTFIHPLTPFPIEESFRSSFGNRADRTRPEFLGLVASMLAAVSVLFPRTVLGHLRETNQGSLPDPTMFAEKCYGLALSSRGGCEWMAHPYKSYDDAMTSYFLAVTSEALGNMRAMRMFLAETVTLLREIELSRNDSQESPIATLDDQLGRRIFWAVVRKKRSLFQTGLPSEIGLPKPSTYPPKPEDLASHLEFDGIMAETHQLDPMAGFLASLDVYNTVVALDDDAPPFLSWPAMLEALNRGLMDAKNIIRQLPSELQISSSSPDDAISSQSLSEFRLALENPDKKRTVQFEILKASLHVSLLATRAYFVTQHSQLRQEHLATMASQDQEPVDEDGQVLQRMRDECGFLAQDVVAVMANLPQYAVEPDFYALYTRLSRVISCALGAAPEGDSMPNIAALRWLDSWLGRMVNTLTPSADKGCVSEQDEAHAEVFWAELRDWQRRVTNGGADGIANGELPIDLQAGDITMGDDGSAVYD